ncbi:MAG TPA: carboxymuconolactone decarboxylase family protein [Actinomycetota bacterium]|nr:carboxymuconolactone decarboxylase family protein [Actinomycetota bacterium]
MARIPLLFDRDGLDPEGRAAFDLVVASRGEVTRPFALLLHAPELASRVAELGHVVRFGSRLADADRELVTLATGRANGCAFVWDSHLDSARIAGVVPEAIAAGGLGERERLLVSFVSELCRTGEVSAETFDAVRALLGTPATVELVLTVGYYTMLSYAMRAFEAC